jgi:hypothetical protein
MKNLQKENGFATKNDRSLNFEKNSAFHKTDVLVAQLK